MRYGSQTLIIRSPDSSACNTTITASYKSASDSVHAGTRPVFALGISPKKPYHHVLVRLQARSGGSWQTVDTRSYKLDSRSEAALTFRGLQGRKFRMRAEYKADRTNLGRNSSYLYVRVV